MSFYWLEGSKNNRAFRRNQGSGCIFSTVILVLVGIVCSENQLFVQSKNLAILGEDTETLGSTSNLLCKDHSSRQACHKQPDCSWCRCSAVPSSCVPIQDAAKLP